MFDPAIKLFGKTIPLPETHMPPPPLDDKDACSEPTKLEAGDFLQEEPCKADKTALDNGKEDNDQTPSQENRAMVDDKDEKDKLKADSDGQEKVLKKPDKIVPCPRCNSLETKFCYYNNYNVNQPRHFCKNCQRYWTAGGTMRNVPVGAGRRKNKHIASQYRQIMMSSDGIPTTQVDTLDSANHQVNSSSGLSTPLGTCNGNGDVLKFGSDAPLCGSMTSVLNMGDQKRKTETGVVCGGNGEEPSSCGSFLSPSTCSKVELPESAAQVEQHGVSGSSDVPDPPTPNPLQCYPGPPWIYPWSTGWTNIAAMTAGRCSSEMFYRMNTSNLKQQVQWGSAPMVVAPAFCSPSMPFPFVPASYWGCMSSNWAAGGWNVPWNGSNGTQSSSSSSNKSVCSSNGSPTLGKHSRDADIIQAEGEDKTEKCLWAPKTLRIDDPDEAAKSSIWATLGIKPGKSEPILKGGIFKAFQPKPEVIDSLSNATQILQANPAALSRSQTFQESN